MSLTPSTMLPLGTKAPDFKLKDVVTGKSISLSYFSGQKLLLVIFLCRHCPYVKHVVGELTRLSKDYTAKGVGIVAISSNDPDHHPEDSPTGLKAMALEQGWTFPVCHDATQKVAKNFRAACTPEFYLFDENRQLVYRGQLDDSRPGNGLPVDGKDLRLALESALKGKPFPGVQKPGIGCNIKWKPGNEPDYF